MTAQNPTVYPPDYKPEPGQHDWSWAFVLYRARDKKYLIGTDASVWSRRTDRAVRERPERGRWFRLKPVLRKTGYLQISLGRKRTFLLHGLVLTVFEGPAPPGHEGCHKNNKRGDCRLDNLRWGTSKSNKEDQRIHGTRMYGERNSQAKIGRGDASEIRRLGASGVSGRILAERFEISQTQVCRIIKRKRWADA